MVTQCTEQRDKVWVVGLKVIELGNVHQNIMLYILILGGPNLLSSFGDDSVLVQMVISGGTQWGGEEMWEEFGFWEDRERKDVTRWGRQGRRRDSGDGGSDNGWWEVLNRDIG